jgi:hypothetical protein
MPPLVLLIVAFVIAVTLLPRLWVLRHKHETRELPFIADITHGICPRCGDTHPEAQVIRDKPASFWQHFSCRCGFAVKAHIKSD